jgi:hypothetical protein
VDWYNDFYNENSRQTPYPDELYYRKSIDRTDRYLQDPDNILKIKNYCEYAGLTYPEFESIDTFYIPQEIA